MIGKLVLAGLLGAFVGSILFWEKLVKIGFLGMLLLGLHDAPIPSNPAPARDCVKIPAGEFLRGSTVDENESPVAIVTISGFCIDRAEVTNQRYRECVGADGCTPPYSMDSQTRVNYFNDPQFSDYPVVHVDWVQARNFCSWAGGRLPTEAEWEKAARANDDGNDRWSQYETTCEISNFSGCLGDTDKVGVRGVAQSPHGLSDMQGNVQEWLADWFGEFYYHDSPIVDPQGPSYGWLKNSRGGSWAAGPTKRAANRHRDFPANASAKLGFRCVYSEPNVSDGDH